MIFYLSCVRASALLALEGFSIFFWKPDSP